MKCECGSDKFAYRCNFLDCGMVFESIMDLIQHQGWHRIQAEWK